MMSHQVSLIYFSFISFIPFISSISFISFISFVSFVSFLLPYPYLSHLLSLCSQSSTGTLACTNLKGNAGSPADYVNMWHNTRARFDRLSVSNVVWGMLFMLSLFVCRLSEMVTILIFYFRYELYAIQWWWNMFCEATMARQFLCRM